MFANRTDEIKAEYDNYMGRVFEKIAHQLIIDLGGAKELPAGIDRLGRWWCKGEEIDAVATGKRNGKSCSMFFEVKWAKMGKKDIERSIAALKRRSELVNIKGHEKHYFIICKIEMNIIY